MGRAVVEQLSAAGYDVVFTYHGSVIESAELVESLTRGTTRRVVSVSADLSDPEAASEKIVQLVRQEFERLDLLVNNASLYQPSNLKNLDSRLLQQLQAVNVVTPLLLCQKFEAMLRESHGHVINMLDLLAERPWPEYLAYCASKAALWNLTLGLARELAPEVTVNGIAPGVVAWPDNYPEVDREKYLIRVPLARAGTPAEVAETVYFLANNASYITGQIIRLDGGRSIT